MTSHLYCAAGEQMVGPKRVVFADEISTGLDSSTTYQIIKWMRDTCHSQLDTMLIALLQPAPETWELFDDVILTAEGACAQFPSQSLERRCQWCASKDQAHCH